MAPPMSGFPAAAAMLGLTWPMTSLACDQPAALPRVSNPSLSPQRGYRVALPRLEPARARSTTPWPANAAGLLVRGGLHACLEGVTSQHIV